MYLHSHNIYYNIDTRQLFPSHALPEQFVIKAVQSDPSAVCMQELGGDSARR